MVGIHKKKHNHPSESQESHHESSEANAPELVRRRANRNSTIRSGRTIGEARERLETKNERVAARKKDKQKKAFRISFTTFGFIVLGIVLIGTGINVLSRKITNPAPPETTETNDSYQPTIEILDEDATAAGGKITSRMVNYIGQLERDLRDLNYNPTRAVVPSGSIREIHFYLDGYTGYLKATIDRGSAVTAEDSDRMLRYLNNQGTNEFEYIDVRVPGKAFYK